VKEATVSEVTRLDEANLNRYAFYHSSLQEKLRSEWPADEAELLELRRTDIEREAEDIRRLLEAERHVEQAATDDPRSYRRGLQERLDLTLRRLDKINEDLDRHRGADST
jgi:hypothetical protein